MRLQSFYETHDAEKASQAHSIVHQFEIMHGEHALDHLNLHLEQEYDGHKLSKKKRTKKKHKGKKKKKASKKKKKRSKRKKRSKKKGLRRIGTKVKPTATPAPADAVVARAVVSGPDAAARRAVWLSQLDAFTEADAAAQAQLCAVSAASTREQRAYAPGQTHSLTNSIVRPFC